MNLKHFRLLALAGCALASANYAAAQAPAPAAPVQAVESKNINEWLMRMHEASRNRSYVGTFVVSSGGVMSSAKIWHVCDGKQQIERVDTLTGPRRSTFRHNDQVVTFLPEEKLVRTEKRESLGLFPALLQTTGSHIGD
ncbi:MAG: sigma-E factor regulatory protein RseB domain-containing protein, partial [Polaromonas sp.]